MAIDGLVTVQPFYEIHPADRIDVSRGCVVRRVRSAEILAGRSIYLGEVTGAWEFASINSNASPFTVEPGHYFALGAYGRKTVSKPVVCVCISEVFEVKEAFQVFVVNEVEE